MDNKFTEVQEARLAELRAKEYNTLTPAEKTELTELKKLERESISVQ